MKETPPFPGRRPWTRLRQVLDRHRFALDVALGATFMMVLHLFVLQISIVKGHSMEPSLEDGDRLVVDRFAADIGDVHRGDVVVLRYPRNPAIDFVKRVVGLPGDRIAMKSGQVYVNGQIQTAEWTCIEDRQDLPESTLPDGTYFVLGDNRPISCDSREFGLVTQELIKGRVRARFWPLDRVAVF
jgi:signal peptidase I